MGRSPLAVCAAVLACAAVIFVVSADSPDLDVSPVHQTPPIEVTALNELYTLTGGANWNKSRGWGTATDPCTWYGVVCADNHTGTLNALSLGTTRIRDTQAGHVLEVNLPYNNLRGPIPPSIGDLIYLKRLYLNGNWLTTLPDTFGKLQWLEIARLMNNVIVGTLPASLGNMTRLRFLSLARNQFFGTIPNSLQNLTAIEMLYLNQNYLSGTVPAFLAGNRTLAMPSLKQLFIHKNFLGDESDGACSERYCAP